MELITVDNTITLDQIQDEDVHDLALGIGDQDVSRNLLFVPHPYELSDAMSFIRLVEKQKKDSGILNNWTIRQAGKVIGGIGQHLKYPKQPHKDEIGYWLGKSHWGQGIMTKVLSTYSDYLFNNTEIIRLEAPTYLSNIGSQRVLQKSGFVQEGVLKMAYKKEDVFLDAILFAKIKP